MESVEDIPVVNILILEAILVVEVVVATAVAAPAVAVPEVLAVVVAPAVAVPEVVAVVAAPAVVEAAEARAAVASSRAFAVDKKLQNLIIIKNVNPKFLYLQFVYYIF